MLVGPSARRLLQWIAFASTVSIFVKNDFASAASTAFHLLALLASLWASFERYEGVQNYRHC